MKIKENIHQVILDKLFSINIRATIYNSDTKEYFDRLLEKENWQKLLDKVSYDKISNTANIICFKTNKNHESILDELPINYDANAKLNWDIDYQCLNSTYTKFNEDFISFDSIDWIYDLCKLDYKIIDDYRSSIVGYYMLLDTYDNVGYNQDNIFCLCSVSKDFYVRYTEIKYCQKTNKFIVDFDKAKKISNTEDQDKITKTFDLKEIHLGGKRAARYIEGKIYIRDIKSKIIINLN